MTRTWTCVAAMIALGSSTALADVESDNAKIALNELNQALKHPAPGPGLDKASPQAAPWCAKAKPVSGINYNWIRRDLEQYQSQGYWAGLIKLAGEVCSADQRQPVMHALNAEILQYWINLTGMSAKTAVASLSVRVDVEAFKADKAKLCDQLKVSDEVGGEDAELMKARRMLFGCQMDEAGWAETKNTERELLEYLDQSAAEPDELVRLAYVVDKAGAGLREHDDYFDHRFAPYAIWSIDFKALDDAKVMKAVSQPPYSSSPYAATVVRESLGRARMGIAVLDAEAKKHASDADWKELLLDAPKKAIDAYTASASKYKDEIQRSNEAERKMFGPSKKASAGCEPVLRKDLMTAWKPLKHATENEALESLTDPVVGLLFSRYVACLAIDYSDSMYARRMYPVMADLRHGRGVRMATYYAVLEALGKIEKDREKFVVKVEDFRNVMPDGHALAELAMNSASGRPAHDSMAFVGDKAKGVVKSAAKTGDLVVITFQTKKHQEMRYNCVDTNRLMSIDSNGRLHYYQHCTEAGMQTVNDTPAPVSVPVLFADKIAAGSIVEIETTRGKDAKERWGFPVSVYADAGKKKLVSWFGFAL